MKTSVILFEKLTPSGNKNLKKLVKGKKIRLQVKDKEEGSNYVPIIFYYYNHNLHF